MAEKNDPSLSRSVQKKDDQKIVSNSLVLDSLMSALDPSLSVVLGSESTPKPPPTTRTKSSKMKLSNLLRPLSPGFRSDSDDSSSSTSPKRKHSSLTRKKRLKIRNGQSKSADSSPVRNDGNGSPSLSGVLETTQPFSLPGQQDTRIEMEKKDSTHSMGVPTILVSPDEEGKFELERKSSQCSHLSASSILTSGAGQQCSKQAYTNVDTYVHVQYMYTCYCCVY